MGTAVGRREDIAVMVLGTERTVVVTLFGGWVEWGWAGRGGCQPDGAMVDVIL